MSRFLGAAAILTACGMSASIASAQNVGIAGEYSESNGVIVHIPQNPPQQNCAASDAAWNAQNNARCPRIEQHFFMTTLAPPRFVNPHHGNYGARLITETANTPTAVGDAFVVPEGLMEQRLGRQVGIVLNNAVRQLDTTFTAAAPGAARALNPTANTRVMRPSAWVNSSRAADMT